MENSLEVSTWSLAFINIYIWIYIYIYAWKLQGINLCLEISSCETGPALMHSNQTYNMCISWVPLVCDVVDWFYLRHEAMADQAIRCHPLPLLAVTCLESSATVASARCIVRSLGSVYSTGTGHKAQGIIYRLYFLSISQYIIIYIYNLIYGICPRHRYIHIFIYIWSTYHSLGICICTYMQPCLNPQGNIVWILLWIPQGFQTNWTLISLIYSF